MSTRILSCDLLICDVIVKLAEAPQLKPLIAQYNAQHSAHPIALGSKSPLTAPEFALWQQAVGAMGAFVAGGSAANTLSTLKKCAGDAVQIDFIAAYGDDVAGRVVAQSLVHDGFYLLPQTTPFPDVQTATSFVLVDARGERSILGFSGNSREKILSYVAKNSLPTNYDILFIPGSLWQKYGEAFARTLYEHCVQAGKTLWLSLPTHSQAGASYNAHVRALIPQAQVVLANAEELKRLYDNVTLAEAFAQLQTQLGAHVAFITGGANGAYVVTQHTASHIPPASINPAEIKNTLGAGDAAFAGFLYGLLCQQTYAQAAEFAMKLAAEKMRHDAARLSIVVGVL